MITKTERQQQIVSKWLNNKCIGTVVAVTGFGKTYTAILAINKLFELEGNYGKITIVVPSLVLKEQWIEELNKHKIPAQVYVINTASKLNITTDLLIIDEFHTAAAETFRLIFEGIKYSKLLALTATIERMDGEHEFLLNKASIIDKITLQEALDNKWVNQFSIYNLAVPFNTNELELYKKADNSFKYFAMQMGYNGFETAKLWLVNGTSEEKGKAMAYYNSMRKRKQIILENSNKLNVTLTIINKFNKSKFIVFSESIKFADDLSNNLSRECVKIHSKMTKKQQEKALALFKSNKSPKRGIASVKALSAGLDLPELDLGIRASFNSSKLVNIQSLGRTLRLVEGKQTRFINLYTPDSQELNWLKKSQDNQNNINWITSIDQIK